MSEKVGELYVDVIIKTGSVDKELDKIEKKVYNADKSFMSLGKTIAGFVSAGVLINFAKNAVKAASDLEEVTSKFNTVFASTFVDVEQSVSLLQKSYMMSEREARQFLSSTQDLLVPMGVQADTAAVLSEEIVKLSADLGSFNNLPTAQVMADIQSALVGNFETTKKYGVVLNETVIKEEAMRLGLYKKGQALDAATKAQIALSLITKGSSAALGDSIRTAGSFANQMKKSQARVEDFTAAIGAPIRDALSKAMISMDLTSESAENMGKTFGGVVSVLIKVVQWVGKAIGAFSGLTTMFETTAQIQNKINEAAKRNPFVGLIKSQRDMGKLIEENARKSLIAHNQSVNNRKKEVSVDQEAINKKIKERDDFLNKIAQFGLHENDIINNNRNEDLKQLEDYHNAGLLSTKKYADARLQIENQYNSQINQSRIQQGLAVAGMGSSFAGELASLQQMATQNEIATIDNREREKQLLIEATYNKQKEIIESTITNEKDKNEALKVLDEDRARQEKALSEKVDKDKRKVQRDAAKRMKTLNIAQTALEIPQAAFRAYSAALVIPPPAGQIIGGINAAAATALGLAKLQILKDQPLPALASGGFVNPSSGGTRAIIGEGGNQEAVLPLTPDIFANLGCGIVDALKSLPTPEATIIDSKSMSEPIMIRNVVNIAGETFYDKITEAITNKQILVNSEAIINI